MSEMKVYHGSRNIIKEPIFGAGKAYNDYGRGFYCTEHLELAKEWGCSEGTNGFTNEYLLDTDDLRILNLSSDEYGVLNWLAILLDNRIGRLSAPIEKRGKDYLLEHFLPDYKKYDVIIGYRADDSYFSFVRAFMSNSISIGQLKYAMNLGKLGEQVVLMSEKAFSSLSFLGYEVADQNIYYAKKKVRDEQARSAFQKELENEDIYGIYMRDILREEMKADDSRLR